MNLPASKRWILTLGSVALALGLAACGGNLDNGNGNGEIDAELSAQEIALLPAPAEEAENDLLVTAEAQPVPTGDAALFDDDDAVETVDVPVDDTTYAAASETFVAPAADGAGGDGALVEDRLTTDDTPAVPEAALLKWGLHPRASDALRSIGITSSRIMQTIGNAAASAGTHAQDGVVDGHPYCAATDLSVAGLSSAQIRHLLEKLGRVGFAAWYRWPGHDGWPSYDVRHIHAVYANAKMKSSLRAQVRSWLVGRNGLVGNAVYQFYRWSATAKDVVRHKFAQSDDGTTNGGSTCVVGGLYCGGDKVSGSSSTLYRCTGTGSPAVVRHCASGCRVNPGSDDSCK